MSLLPVIEICVHLETFRNIDLYQQGLYRLRVQVSNEDNEGNAYDITLKLSPKAGDPHCMDPARLNMKCAESRAFLMRYCNEEVQLKESMYFQIKLSKNSNINLHLDLLFNDLGGKIHLDNAYEVPVKDLNMRVISTFDTVLEFPFVFKSRFIPVLFPVHISLATCIVHYLLSDFSVKQHNFGTVSIFKDRSGSIREYVGSSETDKIYKYYIDFLTSNYKSLSDYYLLIMGRCINQEMRMSLEHRCFPATLKLPGESDPHFLNFSQRVASHNPEKISKDLINELHIVSGQILQLWRKMLDLVNKTPRPISRLLREQYNTEVRNIIGRGVVRKVFRTGDFAVLTQKSIDVNHSLAENKRLENQKNKQELIIIDTSTTDPIIIDEIFLSDAESNLQNLSLNNLFIRSRKKFSELHLFVLAHGYMGSSKDMMVLRNEISTIFPYAIFLLSVSNEGMTENSIGELGGNLAMEIRRFLEENALNQVGCISFIGHSLGGLIIRAALPLLIDLSEKFHLLLTLSTPHLGVCEGSRLIRAGIWIMNYVKKADSLSELRLSDAKLPENTYLFKLSQAPGPDLFHHFALVSSPQDNYSPHFSSRIEVSRKMLKQHTVYGKMAKNLLNGRVKLHRIDTDFKIQNTNIDSLIGRAGHIEFLENRFFMKFLLYLHPEFFE